MNQQAERRVGTVIGGKWRIDALLGSGSMAAVYGATHRNGARAALKILHPTLCTDPAVCERFLGEGYLANSVKHPGIVRVLDDGMTDDGCVFLVMDLLEGFTLEALRQNRGNRIPLVEALDIADKLMDVLAAVHAAGIIHRDLKPQNVYVCNDGTLKLFDFGVARVFDRTSQSKLSVFGLVLGTPSFMSPEQALGSREKVDHRSDIWSLGATIFTALTGETVHLGANVQARLLAAATVKARSISMVMPDLPSQLAAAIDMALRFKKEDRWQSVDAMRAAFRTARASLGLASPEAPARSLPPSAYDHAARGASGAPGASGGAVSSGEGEGPGATFVGIGSGDGKVSSIVGSDGSVPPAPTSPSDHPGPGQPPPQGAGRPGGRHPFAATAVHGAFLAPPPPTPPNVGQPAFAPPGGTAGPFAPARRPSFAPDAPLGPRLDGQDGSIPAYGSTLQRDDSDLLLPTMAKRRKGAAGVWVAAVLVAGGLLGAFAFFAANWTAADPNQGASAISQGAASSSALAPATGSVALPRYVPPPTPSTIVIGDQLELDDASEPQSEATKAAPAHKTRPRPTPEPTKPQASVTADAGTTAQASPPTGAPTPGPATAPTPAPPKLTPIPPGLAPDPFGAPD